MYSPHCTNPSSTSHAQVGWLTDKVNRRNLLFAVVVMGEAPCLCTYFVTEYWQFFLLRTLTGISVGGCFPLVGRSYKPIMLVVKM